MTEAIQTEELMQIGELARRCEVTPRTIKYYEELGLLKPTTKSEGGFRLYNEDTFIRLQRIKQMSSAGLSLAAITEVINLVDTISQRRPDQMHPDELLRLVEELEERIRQVATQIRRQEAELLAGRRLHHDLQTALDNVKYYQTHHKWLMDEPS